MQAGEGQTFENLKTCECYSLCVVSINMCGSYSHLESGVTLLMCGKNMWKNMWEKHVENMCEKHVQKMCGSYSCVEGTFTRGGYSHVEWTFTYGSYSHLEGHSCVVITHMYNEPP